jgi:precorrin-3B synthase
MTDRSTSHLAALPVAVPSPVLASAVKQPARACTPDSLRYSRDDACGAPPAPGTRTISPDVGEVQPKVQRSEAVEGRCPGVLRPMRSGDGLIVRLKIGGGIVDTRLAGRIADWSRRWGNGQIDLSSRGNLQLRGLAAQNLGGLRDAVAEAGLLDPSAEGEAVRNVVSSPLSGLDPSAVLDVRPIAHALERRLSLDATLHALPAKFGFVIDDGGALGLDDVAADIRFKARSGQKGPEFAIGLAGLSQMLPGACRAEDIVDVAVALSIAFLDARQGRETSIRRMRDLVAADEAKVIERAAGLWRAEMTDCSRRRETSLSQVLPEPTGVLPGPTVALPSPSPIPLAPTAVMPVPSVVILGLDPRTSPDPRTSVIADSAAIAFLGVGLPFGRITAADLADLAAAAEMAGARELRLTPRRMIVVPLPSQEAAHALFARLSGTAFILHPGDPRRRIAACPGAPSCARGTTPVRDDATALAEVLGSSEVPGSSPRMTTGGRGIVLHVSGCDKGCAHPRQAKLTLIARNGRYQLVRDGRASDLPIERDLTMDQAAVRLLANFAPGAVAASQSAGPATAEPYAASSGAP